MVERFASSVLEPLPMVSNQTPTLSAHLRSHRTKLAATATVTGDARTTKRQGKAAAAITSMVRGGDRSGQPSPPRRRSPAGAAGLGGPRRVKNKY